MPFLPDGLEAALRARNVPAATLDRITKRMIDQGGTPDPDHGAVIDSSELARRYGFALPGSVRSLLALADRYMLDEADGENFRYLRAQPGGWELPLPVTGEEYAITVAKRFDWNTFSNMQLWEHFTGVMSLGWDRGDNRYVVATTCEAAPVFWLDHETADLHGAVTSSLENFLCVHYGEATGVPAHEVALARAPGHWDRENDELSYLDRVGPLTTWPGFLAARADWLVACMAFGGTEGKTVAPEVGMFDLAIERPAISRSEPLALYWTLRSYYLEERDVFDEIHKAASTVSPLAASLVRICESRWDADPTSSSMAKTRAKLRDVANQLRQPQWRGQADRSALV